MDNIVAIDEAVDNDDPLITTNRFRYETFDIITNGLQLSTDDDEYFGKNLYI